MKYPAIACFTFIFIVGIPSRTSLAGSSLSQPSKSNSSTNSDRKSNVELNHGYYLFEHLMRDESKVDQVSIIRSTSPQLKALLTDISTTAKNSLDAISKFAKNDSSIAPDTSGLPKIEVTTRDGIAHDSEMGILFGSESRFRSILLLTQIEASEYAKQLLLALGGEEANDGRKRTCEQLAGTWNRLHDRIIQTLTPDGHK